ncbi:hypothetical protein TCDM_07152 [Trypanosoma cruzi Dm28c]|uniref:Uncharacterized protein n=1 Tax=Trypanosoma cruzi Dm28c TaxID=1416333 RepID=V5AV69_TRYCR|nr:hypothetical protein TCDM_07152 [Trypanosoma cruzi Dm28c]PBJ74751.1 hypothetical protein BCY84_12084 [Trypanosoma cruzi cruzi]
MEGTSQLCGLFGDDREITTRSDSCASGDAADYGDGGGDGGNGSDVGAAAVVVDSAASSTRKQASLNSLEQRHMDDDNTMTKRHCYYDCDPEKTTDRPALSNNIWTEVKNVTVMVPTMFTTAGGRQICVREKRHIARGSPYWRLLFECPLHEGAALSSHTDEEEGLNKKKKDEKVEGGEESGAAGPHRGLLPAWRRRPREANTYSTPSLATFLQGPRCRSSPLPPSDERGINEDCGDTSFTFSYSSFTRADGSMIYLSRAPT